MYHTSVTGATPRASYIRSSVLQRRSRSVAANLIEMGSFSGKVRHINVRIIEYGKSSDQPPLEVQGTRLSPKPKKPRKYRKTDVMKSWSGDDRQNGSTTGIGETGGPGGAPGDWAHEGANEIRKTSTNDARPTRVNNGVGNKKLKENMIITTKKVTSSVGKVVVAKRRTSSQGRSGSRMSSKGSGGSRLQQRRNTLDINKTDNLPACDSPEASNIASLRLKQIVKMLRYEDVSKFVLIKNLEYTITVLETAYKAETQRICNEEDEDVLSSAPSAKEVPAEVRDWLASTFTRSLSNIKKREDKLHFRSVANAIRAGIVVDRIYRRMSSTVGLHVPPNVLLMLKNLDDWSFDVFQVNEIGEGHVLKYVGYELLQKHDLISKFKINSQALDNFLVRMEQGYSKHGNTYHNLQHAADVTQTTHHLITQSGLGQWLTDLEIFAVLVAAMIHDYEHTGTTNAFHINTSSDVALLYNDKAVLENHHVSAVFRLFKDENFNILANLKQDAYREFRAVVIEIVLATDMSYHFQQLKTMKSLLLMPENIDKSKALSLLVHCADISHPAKEWNLHKTWTELLIEEFFRQGDKEAERKIPISPLCDRKNTMIAESQIGFIDFIVDPSFQVMGDMLDKIMAPLHNQQLQQQQQQQQQQKSSGASAAAPPLEKNGRSPLHRTGSVSSVSSRGSINSSSSDSSHHSNDGPTFEVKRYWVECLKNNKQCWKERAAKDAAQKAADDAMRANDVTEERVISPNLGIVTSSDHPVLDGTEPPSRTSKHQHQHHEHQHQHHEHDTQNEHSTRTNGDQHIDGGNNKMGSRTPRAATLRPVGTSEIYLKPDNNQPVGMLDDDDTSDDLDLNDDVEH